MNQSTRETDAQIIDGKLVISISAEYLASLAKNSDYFFDLCQNGTVLEITDPDVFAQSVANALNLEEEDGSTPVTKILDEAMVWVSEMGEPGIEEV